MTAKWESVSLSEFARRVGKSGSTIHEWCKKGMPHEGGGASGRAVKIDPAKALPWVVESAYTPGTERERLARVQADKVELENDKRRSELVEMSFVQQWSMEFITGLTGELDGLPGRCAAALVGMTAAEARARLLDETRAIRAGMAQRLKQLADAPPDVEAAGEDGDAAPPPKRERVGGRKPSAAPRKRRAGTVSE